MNKKLNKRLAKILIISGIIVVIGVGGYFGYTKFIKKSTTATVLTYMPVKATVGTISVSITASGSVSSAAQQDIVSSNTGTLDELNVKEGDSVKQGAVIGKISDTSAAQAVQASQNALNQQNLNLTKLNKSLTALTIKAPIAGTVKAINGAVGDDTATISNIYKSTGGGVIVITTVDQGDVSVTANGTLAQIYVSVGASVSKGTNLFRLNGDDINSSIAAQNLTIQQAKNDLANKQAALANTTLTSPFDAVIASLSNKKGDSVQNAKAIATVYDPTKMQTVVSVDELDIAKVTLGLTAEVSLDAITGKKFTGVVTKIAALGKTTNSVTTYDVTIALDNPEGVKVGMTANASIFVQKKENVIVVSATAVQRSADGRYVINSAGVKSTAATTNTTTAKANASGVESSRPIQTLLTATELIKTNGIKVEVGLSTQSQVEITSGLKDGDEILIPIQNNTSATQRTATTTTTKSVTGGFGGGAMPTGGDMPPRN